MKVYKCVNSAPFFSRKQDHVKILKVQYFSIPLPYDKIALLQPVNTSSPAVKILIQLLMNWSEIQKSEKTWTFLDRVKIFSGNCRLVILKTENSNQIFCVKIVNILSL